MGMRRDFDLKKEKNYFMHRREIFFSIKIIRDSNYEIID